MSKTIKLSLLFLWLVLLSLVYSQQLPAIDNLCGEEDGAGLCKEMNYFYLTSYFLILLSAGFIAYFRGSFAKPAIWSMATLLVAYHANAYSANELSDIRTYSYEAYITSFSFWVTTICTLFFASMLWSVNFIRAALCFTLVISLLFIFEGRGSVEHIFILAGSNFFDSALFKVIATLTSFYLVYTALRLVATWIKTGNLRLQEYGFKNFYAFVLICLIPLTSIPAGMAVNALDVEEAKSFIEEIVPEVEKHKEQSNEYPANISDFIKAKDAPRLVDVYEYLAYQSKGSYYFSRPEKYCFVVFNPGHDFGYYSITNERGWKFFANDSSSLEQEYLSICDEGGIKTEQGLLAARLGIPDPDNPIAKMGAAVGNVFRRPNTPAAAGKLQEVIDELGKKDPSIYKKQ